MIDYVAMDIKSPLIWEKYREAAGIDSKELFERVKQSVRLLLKSKVEYEFRTTVVPGLLTEEDIIKIAEQIKGTKKYALQQFIPNKSLQEDYNPYIKAIIAFFIFFTGAKLIYFFLTHLVAKWTKKTTTQLDDIILFKMKSPIFYIIVLAGIATAINFLPIPTLFKEISSKAVISIVFF